jgi:hypothetical protein
LKKDKITIRYTKVSSKKNEDKGDKMKQSKTMLISIIVAILFMLALPTGVYAYQYNQYKNSFNKARSLLDNEKYDESINAFNGISNTYFGKKDLEEIKKEIEKAQKFKENKKVYDEALKLFIDKKYLEAIDSFKEIPEDDTKRYELAKKKIDEAKSLYITLNIENAKSEAKSNNYDSAINYLALVLALDADNKDASTLKDEYIKAKEAAALKAKQEAEAKAKQEAEAKARREAEAKAKQQAADKAKKETVPKFDVPPRIGSPQAEYVPKQVSGAEAIKSEFKKVGFIFQSDIKATYNKNGASVILEYIEDGGGKGSCWALSTNTWNYGYEEEEVIVKAMIIILGRERASNNLSYIHYALTSSDSYETPDMKALVYSSKLYVFVYIPK